MTGSQQYRPLKAGEFISNGDQYLDTCGNWIGYGAHRFGEQISELATGRRPVWVEQEQEQPADQSLPTLPERLQASLDDAICCNMNLQTQRDKLQAEVAASQRMYMEAMKALEREVMMHRETNGTLDEVCRERDALQEQLKQVCRERDALQEQLKQVCFDRNVLEEQLRARRSEISVNDILDFLGVQIAVIPYLQAAVSKDAQRELALVGRTLQMVGKAIENDRIGRDGEGKEATGGKK